MRFSEWLKGVLILLIVLGVVFRFVNLNHKVYWHDEAYTSLRAAGYTRSEIDQELFQNRVLTAQDLQAYQRIKPGSTIGDTVRSLAVEDPQHPPLYFVMTRVWMQMFGDLFTSWFHSPLTVMRSLPALISLLSLPAIYALAWELFASSSVALMATTLLALSPFDVLFAQTARQYSLLTVMVISSSFLLLRAIRLSQVTRSGTAKRHVWRSPDTWLNWGLYAVAIAIGLYAHPFFALTLIAHGVYVALCPGLDTRAKNWNTVLKLFVSAVAIALLSFSPWLVVLLLNLQRAFDTTNWLQLSPGIGHLAKLWTLSFTALFFDLDFGFANSWTFLARVPILLLIGVALYAVFRRTPASTWLFVLLSTFVPFLLLAVPDVVLGGKRSAVSRYLISCYPGVQLAVAYFLAMQLSLKRVYSGRSPTLSTTRTAYTLHPDPYADSKAWLYRGSLLLLVLASLTSLTVSALSNSWWNKDLSYFNDRTAAIINQKPTAMIISDIDDFTNTGELISLSYRLNTDTPLLLLKDSTFASTKQFESLTQGRSAIVFRPSKRLKQTLENSYGKMPQLLKEERLWEITTSLVN